MWEDSYLAVWRFRHRGCSAPNEDSEAASLNLQIQEHVIRGKTPHIFKQWQRRTVSPSKETFEHWQSLTEKLLFETNWFPCSCRCNHLYQPTRLLGTGYSVEIRTAADDVLQGADFALGDAVEFDNAGAITDGRVVLLDEDQAGTSGPSLCLEFCGHFSFWIFGSEPPSGSYLSDLSALDSLTRQMQNDAEIHSWHRLWSARLWMGVSESSSIGIFFLQGRERLVGKVWKSDYIWIACGEMDIASAVASQLLLFVGSNWLHWVATKSVIFVKSCFSAPTIDFLTLGDLWWLHFNFLLCNAGYGTSSCPAWPRRWCRSCRGGICRRAVARNRWARPGCSHKFTEMSASLPLNLVV